MQQLNTSRPSPLALVTGGTASNGLGEWEPDERREVGLILGGNWDVGLAMGGNKENAEPGLN